MQIANTDFVGNGNIFKTKRVQEIVLKLRQIRKKLSLLMTEDEKVKWDLRNKTEQNSEVLDKKLFKIVYPCYLLAKKQLGSKSESKISEDSEESDEGDSGFEEVE